MEELLRVENKVDDLDIQYDILTPNKDIAEIDARLDSLQVEIDKINKNIAKYTNDADWIDNSVAIASGVLCGIIDILFVGELSLESANEMGQEKVNAFVMQAAKKTGYKGDDLSGAIKFLEKKFPIAADKVTNQFGGGLQHHLRDFSHHPTPVGLVFSILTQFTHNVYGTDVTGSFSSCELGDDGLELIGKTIPQKITFGVINWVFHMVSDMAGSSGSVAMGKIGTGIPGPIGSLLKEMSALPMFRKTNEKGYKEFSVFVSKLFNGTLLGKRDENGKIIEPLKVDFRTEVGIAEHLKKQAIPVMINDYVVKGFYFIRRFIQEAKKIHSFKELKNINWERTFPYGNRTIARMVTISSGAFMAVDMADAAIRAAISSGGTAPAFMTTFALRVNVVGVGKFAIAVGTDLSMEAKKNKLESKVANINTQIMYYKEAKVFFKLGDVMQQVDNAERLIDAVSENIIRIESYCNETIDELSSDFYEVNKSAPKFVENNKELSEELLRKFSEV